MDDQLIAGRYRLQNLLGTGGMSEVWSAVDEELDRTVAVKLLARDADPARFEREARAAAGLSHPNICALYDYGEDGGRRYMVLEYLPGGTLEDHLQKGPIGDAEAHRLAREIAAGLGHAHDRGLVHRDLKPSNILFDGEGRAKIADFGIAFVPAATGLTAAGTILGTASYLSPEQAAGQPASPASDVYAFGVILYRMLTGRLPFEAPDALTVAAMHRDKAPPPVSDVRPDAPPLLESLAMASLAKSPGDRPKDGRALLTELGLVTPPSVAAPMEETALTQVIASPPPPTSHRRRRVALAAVVIAVLAAAGVGLAMGLGSSDGGPAVQPSTSAPTSTTKPRSTTTAQSSTPTFSTESTTSTEATTSTSTPQTTTTSPPLTTQPVTTERLPPPTTAPVTTTPPPPPPTTTFVETTPTTTAAATTTEPPPTFTDTAPAPATTAPASEVTRETTTEAAPTTSG